MTQELSIYSGILASYTMMNKFLTRLVPAVGYLSNGNLWDRLGVTLGAIALTIGPRRSFTLATLTWLMFTLFVWMGIVSFRVIVYSMGLLWPKAENQVVCIFCAHAHTLLCLPICFNDHTCDITQDQTPACASAFFHYTVAWGEASAAKAIPVDLAGNNGWEK